MTDLEKLKMAAAELLALGKHEYADAIYDAIAEKICEEGKPIFDEDGEMSCCNPKGHEYAYTGTAYGGDDESYHGEGRCYCIYCGADGDG